MSARCVGILLLASASLPACIFSPNSLPYLEQQANLIVVGTASGVYRPGTPSVLRLEIGRVVMGDPALTGQGISVSWTPIQCPMRGEFPFRGAGIWFLQRVDSGWTLLPVTGGDGDTFFPAPPGPILSAYDYAPTASLDDKLAAELCAAIESATREGIFQQSLYWVESGGLDELKSPLIPLLYRRMSGSTLPRQRIVGLGGLIRSGSTAALISAVQSERDFAQYKNENGILLGSIGSRFRAADPDSIRVLGQASSDSVNLNPGFREAVAHALASIHTKDTLPYLAALLDDPLPKLRAQGVEGLASFANNLLIPSDPSAAMAYRFRDQPGPYKNEGTLEHFPRPPNGLEPDESPYLIFWSGWWSRNRASLGY